jgi:vanillate O-demethylase ferredoxin subunit
MVKVISSPIQVRVRARTDETSEIMLVTLEPVNGVLPAVEAGAHIDIEVAPDCIRQYSLCQEIGEDDVYRLGILRASNSRGGSIAAFDQMRVGKEVRVGAPRNNFALKDCAGSTHLYAGGIGITPLLPMAEALRAQGRTFKLHYATRSRDRTPFLARLSRPGLKSNTSIYHDDAVGAPRFDAADIPSFEEASQIYICGPSGFIDSVRSAAVQRGWPLASIHIEKFQNDVDWSGDRFTVVAARSGLSVEVAEGETIAEKLLDAGVDVPLSCEEGICGACLTAVLEGQPDHRDAFQTEAEKHDGTHMTLCCSRSRTPIIVVDI